jgi:hypothetical protein
MLKIDYDRLAADVKANWDNAPNPDNDPIVAASKRGSKLFGDAAAFVTSEINRTGDDFDPIVLVGICAALFTNMVMNVVRVTSSPGVDDADARHELIHIALNAASGYLHDGVGVTQHGLATFNDDGLVTIHSKEVGDA